MYKIIGADGREYGPVPASALKQWIAEGRANVYTRVLAEGSQDWKKLSELPEFSQELKGDAPVDTLPVVSPSTRAADVYAETLLSSPIELDAADCVRRGWELFQTRPWLLTGLAALMLALTVASSAVPVLGSFAAIALAYVIWGGLDWMVLKMARGQKADPVDAFAGFTVAFVPLLLFSIVGISLTALGFSLLIVPGIYLVLAWHQFTALLILDKALDFWSAMEVSRKVVTGHLWAVSLLVLLNLAVILLGLIACGVGVFAALPVTIAARVYAYEELFGTRSASAQHEPGSGQAVTKTTER